MKEVVKTNVFVGEVIDQTLML